MKRLLKENKITGVKFDSEAGMFCAYSENKEKLKELCDLFKPLVGNEEDFQVEAKEPLIPLDDAEKLLLKGFVLSLDKKAQEDFFKYVPYPTLSKKQFEYIEAIQNGDEHAMINAAKKINSETRTLTRKWDNYL